jgi:hypothetical protein
MSTTPEQRTAWLWIGFGGEGGDLRVKGGRTLYEAADNFGGEKVRLARLNVTDNGLRQVNRYVDADTILEFIPRAEVDRELVT